MVANPTVTVLLVGGDRCTLKTRPFVPVLPSNANASAMDNDTCWTVLTLVTELLPGKASISERATLTRLVMLPDVPGLVATIVRVAFVFGASVPRSQTTVPAAV